MDLPIIIYNPIYSDPPTISLSIGKTELLPEAYWYDGKKIAIEIRASRAFSGKVGVTPGEKALERCDGIFVWDYTLANIRTTDYEKAKKYNIPISKYNMNWEDPKVGAEFPYSDKSIVLYAKLHKVKETEEYEYHKLSLGFCGSYCGLPAGTTPGTTGVAFTAKKHKETGAWNYDELPDLDQDGIPDIYDDDIDGDGVPNQYDQDSRDPSVGAKDTDGDGVPDYLDYDPNDPNLKWKYDIDGDGIPNDEDDDIDGDGVPNDEDPAPWNPYITGEESSTTTSDIRISSQPHQKTFHYGEAFNIDGLEVEITLEDGTKEYITPSLSQVTGYDSTSPGQQTITVTVDGKSTTYTVWVEQKEIVYGGNTEVFINLSAPFQTEEEQIDVGIAVTKYFSEGGEGTTYDPDDYDSEETDWESEWNEDGTHKETGTEYDPDGYDINGYDENGWDKDGWNESGYNHISNSFYKDGYDVDGYDSAGYDRSGYNKDGYDRDGYNRAGFDRSGRHKSGGYYDENGLDVDGWNDELLKEYANSEEDILLRIYREIDGGWGTLIKSEKVTMDRQEVGTQRADYTASHTVNLPVKNSKYKIEIVYLNKTASTVVNRSKFGLENLENLNFELINIDIPFQVTGNSVEISSTLTSDSTEPSIPCQMVVDKQNSEGEWIRWYNRDSSFTLMTLNPDVDYSYTFSVPLGADYANYRVTITTENAEATSKFRKIKETSMSSELLYIEAPFLIEADNADVTFNLTATNGGDNYKQIFVKVEKETDGSWGITSSEDIMLEKISGTDDEYTKTENLLFPETGNYRITASFGAERQTATLTRLEEGSIENISSEIAFLYIEAPFFTYAPQITALVSYEFFEGELPELPNAEAEITLEKIIGSGENPIYEKISNRTVGLERIATDEKIKYQNELELNLPESEATYRITAKVRDKIAYTTLTRESEGLGIEDETNLSYFLLDAPPITAEDTVDVEINLWKTDDGTMHLGADGVPVQVKAIKKVGEQWATEVFSETRVLDYQPNNDPTGFGSVDDSLFSEFRGVSAIPLPEFADYKIIAEYDGVKGTTIISKSSLRGGEWIIDTTGLDDIEIETQKKILKEKHNYKEYTELKIDEKFGLKKVKDIKSGNWIIFHNEKWGINRKAIIEEIEYIKDENGERIESVKLGKEIKLKQLIQKGG